MKKKDKSVHIICILDRSGSMRPLQNDVIGSFNNFLEEQRKEKGKAHITLVLFDDKYEVVYDRNNIETVPDINDSVYYARGMTALYDAIGKTLATYNDKDAIVLIQTDGEENYSKEYNHSQIKDLIKEKEDKGWEFLFMGANIDTAKEGLKMGIDSDKTMNFAANSRGIATAYASMDNLTKNYRASKLDDFED